MPRVVPTLRARAARRSGVLAALVLLMAVLGAAPAAAHNTLRSTDPAEGSTVATPPTQVTLTFDQPAVELGTQVVVTGPDGVVVSDGPAQLVDASVVQPLVATPLPAGTYAVDWRVTSADGHPLSGSLTFAVTAPAAAEPTQAPETAAATPDAAATDDQTVEPAPTSDVTMTAVGGPLDQEGTSPWVWVAVTAALVAVAGTAAVVASRRRAAQGGDVAAGPATGTSADRADDGSSAGA
ncbi:copper resistance CopC family protein [Cellulomonas dongxiuzhuiae]|uniref:Copper resistance protein CopC n=1 Tax=Cellulomonas dongxiuzhuiae TaxID=2819979 RepID=A0ABX8GIQ5_9CELL|nr:copper resistance CopC family protein [Cellulomonas dongxiuzhuiae]MBO3094852.1 copper resistance protein CopC [Cellulomonas dongxiuzhuiae]QWC15885.1 copper resistance protein CopC [Cellulomonas dongxiuzhuiae]